MSLQTVNYLRRYNFANSAHSTTRTQRWPITRSVARQAAAKDTIASYGPGLRGYQWVRLVNEPSCTPVTLGSISWNSTNRILNDGPGDPQISGSMTGDSGSVTESGGNPDTFEFFSVELVFRTTADQILNCDSDYRVQVTANLDGSTAPDPLGGGVALRLATSSASPLFTPGGTGLPGYSAQDTFPAEYPPSPIILLSPVVPVGQSTGIHIWVGPCFSSLSNIVLGGYSLSVALVTV